LAALLPGTYRLRFSAAGFDPIWYPAAADEATAELLPVAPVEVIPDLDVTIAGKPGALLGQVAAPQGAGGGAPATVTVTLLPASPDQAVPPPQTVTTSGEFAVEGMVTPARYQVSIERPGFDRQVVEVELGGGQATVLDTSNLLAANGSISGRVVDGAGSALGGVVVTLRSGSIERTITTPTVGTVGSFTFQSLEAPRTYVLTFSLAGYTSATVALELAGGESRSGVSAILIGGAGSVQGRVTNAGGQPLGGVTVLVQGRGLQLQTATLTSGVGVNGIGTYSLSGLVVPGTYTITFSKSGFVTTTAGVTFTAAGLQSALDASLAPASSTVAGAVSIGAVPTSGLLVVLHDGITSRQVVTTATPAGAYSFSNVGAGSYTLTVTGSGVQQRIVLVVVVKGTDLTRNISMLAGP